MNDRICLFCGKPLTNNIDDSCWHKACIKSFFGEDDIPFRDINDTVIDALTLTNIKEGNVTTGVQKKLSVE